MQKQVRMLGPELETGRKGSPVRRHQVTTSDIKRTQKTVARYAHWTHIELTLNYLQSLTSNRSYHHRHQWWWLHGRQIAVHSIRLGGCYSVLDKVNWATGHINTDPKPMLVWTTRMISIFSSRNSSNPPIHSSQAANTSCAQSRTRKKRAVCILIGHCFASFVFNDSTRNTMVRNDMNPYNCWKHTCRYSVYPNNIVHTKG